MNTPISLTSDLLDSDVAIIATSGNRFVSVFDPKSPEPKAISMPDFGTLLVGFNSREEIEAEELMPFFVGELDTVWLCPSEFKIGHVAKRFGMFPSANQASKNGFGGDIPLGFSQILLRANKLRGVLTIFKKA